MQTGNTTRKCLTRRETRVQKLEVLDEINDGAQFSSTYIPVYILLEETTRGVGLQQSENCLE